MIQVNNIEVWGFEHAIRGMRNPMNSWSKSDSTHCYAKEFECPNCRHRGSGMCIGDADLELMRKLYKGGAEHRKYLRQIFVSMDITAPLYWWKEFDTYKIGTTSNSCSTMHKIADKEFTLDDFSHERLLMDDVFVAVPGENEEFEFSAEDVLVVTIDALNAFRDEYLKTKNKLYWWQMIQLLPSSYNQRRTITMSYENVVTIIKQRKGHKLDEWNDFVHELERLPYIKEIMDAG